MSIDASPRLVDRLARRSACYATSPWAAIDAHLSAHPDLIYFGSGAPAAELYPMGRFAWAAEQAWERMDPRELDYGELAGYPPLRELIAERMAGLGVDTGDEILITNGSQQGIDFAAKLFLDPGDVVVVEAPTYIGALQALDGYEPTYWSIPMDAEGLDVEALRRRIAATGLVPKLAYVIPTYQNPTGRTMSLDRRTALIDLCAEHGIAILEDDPYGEMWYREPPPVAMRGLSADVIYLGTFSKTMAPGVRVGWMVAPAAIYDRLLLAKEATDINAARPMMREMYLAANGFIDDHVLASRPLYARRRDAMVAALRAHMPPGVTWIEPDGGFFTWVTLADGLNASNLLPVAARHGAGFLPGRFFYPPASAVDDSLRLSFSSLTEERITTGVERLARAITEVLAERAI